MRRDMSEVLRSQQIMLGKEKDVAASAFPAGLDAAFKKQVAKVESWIDSQPNVQVLDVNYSEVLENPKDISEGICSFLGRNLDTDKMSESVDKALYRNKMKASE